MRQKIIGDDIINYEMELNKIIDDSIKSKIEIMNNLLKNINWEGDGKDAFASKYNNAIFEIKKIPNALKLYTSFLDRTMNNYENLMKEIKISYDNLEEDINNSGDING